MDWQKTVDDMLRIGGLPVGRITQLETAPAKKPRTLEQFQKDIDDTKLWGKIEEALVSYRLQYSNDEDGDHLELADVLTPVGEGTIKLGIVERTLLVEHIFCYLTRKDDDN